MIYTSRTDIKVPFKYGFQNKNALQSYSSCQDLCRQVLIFQKIASDWDGRHSLCCGVWKSVQTIVLNAQSSSARFSTVVAVNITQNAFVYIITGKQYESDKNNFLDRDSSSVKTCEEDGNIETSERIYSASLTHRNKRPEKGKYQNLDTSNKKALKRW